MSVSSIAAFGSAAIATPPANDLNAVKRDETTNPLAPPPPVDAAKAPGTGLLLDKTV